MVAVQPLFSRRALLVTASSTAALLGSVLPTKGTTASELTVTEALRSRRSTRAFSDRSIDSALLAEMLWAAFGINRTDSGMRTAPSWHGAQDVSLHVATADGVFAFDPVSNNIALVKPDDIRKSLSPQPFVATAPACLIFLSHLDKLTAATSEEEKWLWATVDAAIAAENVYIFAAARGLGTCLVGGLDRAAITNSLGLAPTLYATFVQPIGWPA